MSKRKTATRIALAAALLAGAVYAGLSGYWLSINRIENANERAYVASPDDEDTRKEVILRCGGPLPAPAQECVQQVENAEEAKQHERADLKAQQEVAEWTFATALIAFAALFLSAGGLLALVWTFREQRKLTINQSQAYLELITAHYTAQRWGSIDEGEDTEDQIDVTLTLVNNGATPALRIKAELVLECTPEHDGFAEAAAPSYTIKGISGELPEIPAKGTYVLRATGRGELPHPKSKNISWRYSGPSVIARGVVSFGDVFSSDRREIQIKLDASEIPDSWNEPPIEFWGWHRARHGTDRILSHHKSRYDKALAEAAKAKADAENSKEES